MTLSFDELRAAPKVLLHDHLDGGVRPQTVIDLAAEIGHELPASDAESLAQWFYDAANSGSLDRYLETFVHTVAVMQTPDALRRVAREAVEDYVADGIVYAEVRQAPELLTEKGLTMDEVVAAIQAGIDEGVAAAEAAGTRIVVRQLLCAMRQNDRADEVAALVLDWRDRGVAGFDIAGPELDPRKFLPAFEALHEASAHYTIHAGEAAGVESVHRALHPCGAERLGHGVRVVEDIEFHDDHAHIGPVAAWVRDRQVVLEVAPSSNLQTGIAATMEEHPFGALADLDFKVTVNTDNRLMSATSVTREMQLLSEAFGYDLDDFEVFTINALDGAFIDHDTRLDLLSEIVERYEELRG